MSKVYKCDCCGEMIEDPYDANVREFCHVAGVDENGIYPQPFKEKTKIHLCDDCYKGLKEIGKRVNRGGGVTGLISPNISFGERLKKIRMERGLSQSQLAAKVYTTAMQICEYEKDRHSPSLGVFESICKALNVTASELLGF